MNTGINRLLASATGPKRLRQELQQKTKPVVELSHLLAKPETLRTAIPDALLGGQLLALLSNRLQNALLLAADDSPETASQSGPHVWALQADAASVPTTDHPALLVPRVIGKAVSPDTPDTPHAAGHPQAPAPEAGGDTQARNNLRATGNQSSAHPHPQPGQVHVPANDRAQPVHGALPQPLAPGRTRAESLLSRQLRRYWQGLESKTVPSTPPDTPGVEARQRGGPSRRQLAFNPTSTGTWPDLIGQATARKVDGLQRHTHGAGEQSQQTVHAGVPENVEIRNVFNIALPASDDGHRQTGTPLAETIADILSEQALQHGIDLT